MYSEEWKQDADPEQFWSLVALARTDQPAFVAALEGLDRKALIRFAWTFEELASALGAEPYASHTDPEFSEDVLDDLWEEVVGRGREFYADVLAHPERMPADVDYSDPSHRMRYAASNVFFARHGEEIPPYGYDYEA
jgi:hypothetical protein